MTDLKTAQIIAFPTKRVMVGRLLEMAFSLDVRDDQAIDGFLAALDKLDALTASSDLTARNLTV